MDSFSFRGSDDWGEAPDAKDLHTRLFNQTGTAWKDQPRRKKSKVSKQIITKTPNVQNESIKVAQKTPPKPQPKSPQEKTDDVQAHGTDKRGTKKKRKIDTNESRIPVKNQKIQASGGHEETTKVEVGKKKSIQSESSTPSEPVSLLVTKKRKRKPRNNKFKTLEFGYPLQEVKTLRPDPGLTPSPKGQTEAINESNSNVESNRSKKSRSKKLKRRQKGKEISVLQKPDSEKVASVKEVKQNQRTKSNVKKGTFEKNTNIQQRTKAGSTGNLNNKKNKTQTDKVKNTDLKTAIEVNIQQARVHFENLSKVEHKGDKTNEDACNGSNEPPPDHTAKQTLKSKMEARLNSAHFRYLNEQLYKTTGSEAYQMMSQDREAFEIYHSGFSQQVKHWPVNPVDIFIENLNTRPENLAVGDFGCGEARIAQSVKQTVHSFDICSLNKYVTVCDIEKVPLKSNSLDIAIFCLSLMGTNWLNYIKEANRVLKMKGQLKIAEVASRFTSFAEFLKIMKQLGFQKESTDFSNKVFLMMEFSKQESSKKVLPEKGEMLRPCLYKKR